jgi:hypothetical protein
MSNGGPLEPIVGKQTTPLQDQENNPAVVKEAGPCSKVFTSQEEVFVGVFYPRAVDRSRICGRSNC